MSLNWTEVEFATLRYFAVNALKTAPTPSNSGIAAYVDRRSTRAQPKGRLCGELTDPDLDQLPDRGCVTSH